MHIRRFTLGDLPAVLTLENRAFTEDAYDWQDFMTLYEAGPETFLVALEGDQDDDELIGYIAAFREGGQGYLVSLAVAAHVRRQGVATALFTQIRDHFVAHRARWMGLHVRTTNTPAIRLYEKLGFTIEATIENYYGLDEPAYYMTCPL